MALSRPKQGFDSPMGHMLLEAYRTSGSFAFTVSLAVQHLLSLLYKDKSLPLSPPSGKTQKKTTRNTVTIASGSFAFIVGLAVQH